MTAKKYKIIKISILFLFLINKISSAAFSKDIKNTYFAGGCFWCMEEVFEKVNGVLDVVSGYSGGKKSNPTYEEVTKGKTGHIEVVKVTYNPSIISYKDLLNIFWVNIDPYDGHGQFCDKGNSYISAIFYQNDNEKNLIQVSLNNLKQIDIKKIKTKYIKFEEFYLAEEYHQDYNKKNPFKYNVYKINCGREVRLKEVWKLK